MVIVSDQRPGDERIDSIDNLDYNSLFCQLFTSKDKVRAIESNIF